MLPIKDDVPSLKPPVITWFLIIANSLVFIFELWLPEKSLEHFFYLFGLVPARYTHPSWAEWVGFPVDNYWPFLTNMFLHGGWLHIISNMWVLWIFGDNVEDRMGHFRFLVFYILCGILAGTVHMLSNPHSTVPALGASGAIAGVLGAYFLLYPFARVIVLVPLFFWPFFFVLPAAFYLGFWFLLQFYQGTFALLAPKYGGGIAWWAHIGGFVAGLVLCPLFTRLRKPSRRLFRDQYGLDGAWQSHFRYFR